MNGTYFGRKLYPKKMRERITKKIKFLGQKKPISPYEFLNIRLFLSIIIFMSSLFIPKFGFIIGIILTSIFYNGYELLLLDYPISKRKEKLEYEAIFYLEVLDATINNNTDLLTALNLTSNSLDNDFSLIIKNALLKLKEDGNINKIGEELQKAIPSLIVTNVFLHLFRISNTKQDWHQVIKEQIMRIKEKQKMEHKKKLNKVPIQIIITSLIFIAILFIILYFMPPYLRTILKTN